MQGIKIWFKTRYALTSLCGSLKRVPFVLGTVTNITE